jgi:exosortase
MSFAPLQKLNSVGLAVGLLATTCWVYRDVFQQLSSRWAVDPEYSHGYLVPLFSLVLLWSRREKLTDPSLLSTWWTIPVLFFGLGLKLSGHYFYFKWVEQCSLLPVLGAICMAVGGWQCLIWAWPGLAFLLFMIPLPGRFESLLGAPLQHFATVTSTNVLQTLGLFAQAEGNVIVLRDTELGIVDACSGLRMLIVFFALSTAVAVVMQRSIIQRILIVVSAIPIALFCNIFRITLTGVLYQTVGSESKIANLVFHDLAGWLMIPMALALLGLELQFFSRLFIPLEASDHVGSGAEAPSSRTKPPVRSRVSLPT